MAFSAIVFTYPFKKKTFTGKNQLVKEGKLKKRSITTLFHDNQVLSILVYQYQLSAQLMY